MWTHTEERVKKKMRGVGGCIVKDRRKGKNRPKPNRLAFYRGEKKTEREKVRNN